MYAFHDIRTQEDAKYLLDLFNNFHDAYISNYAYQGNVRSNCHTTGASISGTELSLTFLVTSMKETPLVEIVFRDMSEWNICKKEPFLEVFGLQFDVMDGRVACTSGCSFDRDVMEKEHYVIASSARWRLVDLPGLRLTQVKRGGCSTGWKYIPLPGDCPGEDMMSICRQLEKYTPWGMPEGKLAIVCPAGITDKKLFAPEKRILATETIPSFTKEEPTAAPDGEPFAWYEITDNESLRLALDYAMNGSMIGVIANGQFYFTVEIVRTEYINVVFRDCRNCLYSNLFCGKKYYAETYYGGGVEEFVPPQPFSPPVKAKYESVNEAELFEFHDAEIRPIPYDGGVFFGHILHLNIHGNTVYNPGNVDKELDSAMIYLHGFRLAEGMDPSVMSKSFTVLRWDTTETDDGYTVHLAGDGPQHKPFHCTFTYKTMTVRWTFYRGAAWYVKQTDLNQ